MREYWTKLNGEPLDIDIKVENWNAIEELLSSLYNSLNKTNTKTKTINKIKPKNKDVTVCVTSFLISYNVLVIIWIILQYSKVEV